MLFQDERFGMFIHWGIYSLGAWHEQEQWRRNIPKDTYTRQVERFNPQEFCPEEWMNLVKQAGMDYICFTTKHHDGFCMWDTKQTDYNIMHTPYGQDILRKVADSCQRSGVKLALYYSVPDWHHPNSLNFGGDHQLPQPNPGDEPDEERYKAYIRAQMQELLTGYGPIDALFWDIPPVSRDESMNTFVRSLQPNILINDRGYSKGDYSTPERHVPEGQAFPHLTEACQSVSLLSWGYRAEDDLYSALFLMQSIDSILSRGGNYLLNVGPDAQGHIPEAVQQKLLRIGDWYNHVRECYLHARPVSIPGISYRMTARDNYLYIHLDAVPVSSGISLRPITELPTSAVVLNTMEPLRAAVEYMPYDFVPGQAEERFLHINRIPVDALTGEVIILRLEFSDLDRLLGEA